MRKEDYDQVINGKRYLIKAGETVTLNRNEAVDVKGFYIGADKPVSLRIEHLPDEDDIAAQSPKRVYCAPDGKEFPTQADCLEYIAGMKKKG
jgi:hypothetical protein